jgi:hypothetical protein
MILDLIFAIILSSLGITAAAVGALGWALIFIFLMACSDEILRNREQKYLQTQ